MTTPRQTYENIDMSSNMPCQRPILLLPGVCMHSAPQKKYAFCSGFQSISHMVLQQAGAPELRPEVFIQQS